MMTNIAVLGANGQLGQSLQKYSKTKKQAKQEWHFFTSADINITRPSQIDRLFNDHPSFDYLINCAAYTAVDQAEKEHRKAKAVNADAVKYLAECCEKHGVILIHISTDFVFDGKISRPLTELDSPRPIGVYGQTKYNGEVFIKQSMAAYFILRTGWLYATSGANFLNTMLRLTKEKNELKVVCDQVGTPTHTEVLCRVITTIINTRSRAFGLYHVGNEGVASWYDFTYEIIQNARHHCKLTPILTKDYPTPAKRPAYSVLDKTKLKTTFNLKLPHWKESLKKCF